MFRKSIYLLSKKENHLSYTHRRQKHLLNVDILFDNVSSQQDPKDLNTNKLTAQPKDTPCHVKFQYVCVL